MEHAQGVNRYATMNRDYLLISSGKQWRPEKHQENNSVASKQLVLLFKCRKSRWHNADN